MRCSGDGYSALSQILPEFAKLGKFQIDKFHSQSYDPETLEKLFSARKAVYHKNCFSKFSQQKLLRAQKAFEPHLNDSRNELVSPKRARILLGELKCLFCMKPDTSKSLCAVGTLHAKQTKVNENHVREFTEKITAQANALGKTQIVSRISTGDMTTNDIY